MKHLLTETKRIKDLGIEFNTLEKNNETLIELNYLINKIIKNELMQSTIILNNKVEKGKLDYLNHLFNVEDYYLDLNLVKNNDLIQLSLTETEESVSIKEITSRKGFSKIRNFCEKQDLKEEEKDELLDRLTSYMTKNLNDYVVHIVYL